MQKEIINQKQAIVLMVTFIMGSGTIVGTGDKSGQDIWIALLIAMAGASIIMAVYARIIKLFPGMDLFDLLDKLFGRILGKFIALIFTWYLFHVGLNLIRNTSEFIRIISLDATPQCVIALFTGVLIAYALRCGIEVIGRWVSIFFPVIIVISITLSVIAVDMYDFDRLKPVLYEGLKPVLSDAFGIFAHPFAETVVFLGIAGCFQKQSNPHKIFNIALLIGGLYMLMLAVRTIALMGPVNKSLQMFPPYITARIIKIGDFFQRIELINAVIIVTAVFTKVTVYMFSFAKGMSYLLKIDDYRTLSTPLVFFTAAYSIFLFDNALFMVKWALNVFPYYAIPFEIIIPLLVWIAAEIKARNDKKTTSQNQSTNSSGSNAGMQC
ncbi:MAG: endospore germination permease [Clostridiaceae bacterium]|nr:endospore germination permease [Clostridiaceae bacterium]